MGNLLRRLAGRNAGFLLINMFFLAGFQFLICAVVANVNVSGAVRELMNNLPPFFRAVIEEEVLGGLTQAGLVAFGWNHPVALAVGAAVAIVLAARAIAGEVESGGAELILSHPVSRAHYFTGQVLFALLALGLLALAGAVGSLAGETAYRLELFRGPTLLRLVLNYTLLQIVWFGLTLLLSSYGRESGRVAFTGFFFALVSYLIQLIGRLWPDASDLLTWSVFTYYSPRALLTGSDIPFRSVAVLAGLFIATTAAAAVHFSRRDLP